MAYSFNQTFTGLDSDVLSVLPGSFSSAALDAIDVVTSNNQSATQKDVIQALYNDVENGTSGVQHEDLYLYVLAEISQYTETEVWTGNVLHIETSLAPKTSLEQDEQSAWLWVGGAFGVNSDDGGFFSEFIREQTAKQFELRYGTTTTNENL